MGARGRGAVRAPVPAGDRVSDHDLVERARGWMAEQHPHFDHMQRALDWALVLDPDASDAVQIAAVTHDAERAYPDPDSEWDSAVSWADPEYNRWHQERCARIVGEWLREQGAEPQLTDEVEQLVRVHEDGGWPEANIVQAADSLSFLETMVWILAEWIQSGRCTRESSEGKARHSLERISPELVRAREEAEPLLASALHRLAAVSSPADVLAALALVSQGRILSLARERFPRMPLFPGHPTFEVLSYRSPQGIRAAGDRPWGPVGNDGGPRLHERARDGHDPQRRAYRRSRAHDGRPRRSLERRLGPAPPRRLRAAARRRHRDPAAVAARRPLRRAGSPRGRAPRPRRAGRSGRARGDRGGDGRRRRGRRRGARPHRLHAPLA